MTESPAFIEVSSVPGPAGAPGSRGTRLPRFIGLRRDAEDEIGRLRAAIVGVGSVGSRIADDLARLGVAMIWIVDYKAFKPESLLTHPIRPPDIGQPKSRAVAELCKSLSPQTRVFYFNGSVQELPLDAFADVDLVVLASDNLACEVEVGQRCLNWRLPLFHAAVHGESLTAVARFFANSNAAGPCPRCQFGQAEKAALDAETLYSCQPEGGPAPVPNERPTRSTSSLCEMAAAMASQEILRFRLGLGEPVADALLEYNGYTHRSVRMKLERRPDCPCEHVAWEPAIAPRPLANCTVRELFETARACSLRDDAIIAVEGYDWVDSLPCRCGLPVPMKLFVARPQREAGPCPGCGAEVPIQPFYRCPAVVVRKLGAAAEEPLCRVGVPAPRTVLLRTETRQILYRCPTQLLPK